MAHSTAAVIRQISMTSSSASGTAGRAMVFVHQRSGPHDRAW